MARKPVAPPPPLLLLAAAVFLVGAAVKPGVDLSCLRPPAWAAVGHAAVVYGRRGLDLTVTSGCEGRHMPGSLHDRGLAVDLRIRHVPAETRPALAAELAAALGPDYDVVLESDHLHAEYDP